MAHVMERQTVGRALPYGRSEAKAWAVETLRGYYECPITPVTRDYEIDEAGIRENVEAFVGMQIPGLVVGGNVAEGWNFTPSQWLRYHKIVADANKGRMRLWTIILDSSVHQALEKLAAVQELGYEGAEVMNPPFQLKSDDEIFEYFKFLTDRSPLAVMLYRTPVSGKLMGVDLLQRLCDLDTVVGMKQGSLMQGDTLRVRRALRRDLVISEALEYAFLEDLRYGGQVMWANFCYIVFGKQRVNMKAYLELAAAGRFEEAKKKWLLARAASDVFEDIMVSWVLRTGSYASAIPYVKAWFELVGLRAGPPLPPVKGISAEQRERLYARLKEAGVV